MSLRTKEEHKKYYEKRKAVASLVKGLPKGAFNVPLNKKDKVHLVLNVGLKAQYWRDLKRLSEESKTSRTKIIQEMIITCLESMKK